MKKKKPVRKRRIIVYRYEYHVGRHTFIERWRLVGVSALGGFFVGVGALRLWLLTQ